MSSFEVTVITDKKTFKLPINPKSTNVVCDIKRAVQQQTGLHPTFSRLHLLGGVDSFQVPSEVRVFTRGKRQDTWMVKLLTYSVLAKTEHYQIAVDPNDTVLDLKFLLAEKTGHPAECHRFTVRLPGQAARQPLQDDQVLSQAGVTNGCDLYYYFEFPSHQAGHGTIHRSHPKIHSCDASASIGQLFRQVCKKHADRPLLGNRAYKADPKERGEYIWSSYAQVGQRVTNIAAALLSLGLEATQSVGLISINRSEWIIGDLACCVQNFISVPLYDTFGSDAIEYIINHATIKAVICSVTHVKLLSSLKQQGKCPSLQHVIVMDDSPHEKQQIANGSIVGHTHTFSQLESLGQAYQKQHTYQDRLPQAKDVYTICYTSGTTGHPKGAIITHGNLLSSSLSLNERVPESVGKVGLSYLPLAHIYERFLYVNVLIDGAAAGFYSGDVSKLVEDVEYLKPDVFPGVPRVWQRIYDRITAQVSESNIIRRTLFKRALKTKLQQLRNGKLEPTVWDKLIFEKVAARFGGNLRLMSTGSAPLLPAVADFLHVVFGGYLVEGYGLTETCAAGTTTGYYDNCVFGQVGQPLSCCEIKLVDVPDMEYFTSDPKNPSNHKYQPRGEIWIRGTNIFQGYYKQKDITDECMTADGWFMTGDVGTWLPDGNLKIIDRKKNIFKLSQGEYIRPEYIEGVYKQCKYVANVFAHGESTQNSIVAIVVPEPELTKAWAAQNNVKKDYAELCKDPQFTAFVAKEMAVAAKRGHLKGFEVARKVLLTSEDFSVDNGLLTPSFKIKRHIAKKKYEKEIAAMYQQIEQEDHQAAPIKAKL